MSDEVVPIGSILADCPLFSRYPPGMDPVSALAPALGVISDRLEHLANRVDAAIDGQSAITVGLQGLDIRMGQLEAREKERNGSIRHLLEWKAATEQAARDDSVERRTKRELRDRSIGAGRAVLESDLFKYGAIGLLWLIGAGVVGDLMQQWWGL